MKSSDDARETLKSLALDYQKSYREVESLAGEGETEEVFGRLMAAESRVMGEMRSLQMELIGSEGEGLKERMLEFFRLADRLKIVMEFQRDTALKIARNSLSEE